MKEDAKFDPLKEDDPSYNLYLRLSLDSVFRKVFINLPFEPWALNIFNNVIQNHKKAEPEFKEKLSKCLILIEKSL